MITSSGRAPSVAAQQRAAHRGEGVLHVHRIGARLPPPRLSADERLRGAAGFSEVSSEEFQQREDVTWPKPNRSEERGCLWQQVANINKTPP